MCQPLLHRQHKFGVLEGARRGWMQGELSRGALEGDNQWRNSRRGPYWASRSAIGGMEQMLSTVYRSKREKSTKIFIMTAR
eukprot:scaffold115283_cov70-Cyclotella_meneghiniana.AAC.1